jgi:hypothetical protein
VRLQLTLQGAKALEAVTCQTIIQLQTPEDLQLVLQVMQLHQQYKNTLDIECFHCVHLSS